CSVLQHTLHIIRFILLFFFSCYRDHRDLHSFPTRRSSDLRRERWTGLRIALTTGLSRATISRILRRLHLSRMRDLEPAPPLIRRSEEHTSELQSRFDIVCRLLLEKKSFALPAQS